MHVCLGQGVRPGTLAPVGKALRATATSPACVVTTKNYNKQEHTNNIKQTSPGYVILGRGLNLLRGLPFGQVVGVGSAAATPSPQTTKMRKSNNKHKNKKELQPLLPHSVCLLARRSSGADHLCPCADVVALGTPCGGEVLHVCFQVYV